MNQGMYVQSTAAIDGVRAALVAFQTEASQGLASALNEARRFADWLKHEQLAYWKHELRRREELVAEAKSDLHRCLSATIDPRRTPSCLQEKKLLAAAKRRLEEAEQKLAAVRRWIPLIDQAITEFTARCEPLSTYLTSGVANSLAELDRSLAQIAAYLAAAPPRSANAEPGAPP